MWFSWGGFLKGFIGQTISCCTWGLGSIVPTPVPCWELRWVLDLPWEKQSQGLGSSGHEPQPGLGEQQLRLEHCTWRFYLILKINRKGSWRTGCP